MRLLFFLLLTLGLKATAQKQDYKTFFEKGNGNQSADYQETIRYFQMLADHFPAVDIMEMGLTDSGLPLHLVVYNPDKTFAFPEASENKAVILINNGIHAGEPDGIDASMMLIRDLATGKVAAPVNTIVAVIPVYNIGGALNRNTNSRVNQNGPEVYGFRGNARNYDLNRDFLKQDTRNSISFADIFHKLNPEVFIDNHVSNGADYQYTLTYIMTQHNKLGEPLGSWMNAKMTPDITAALQKKGIESTPYVNVWGSTPDKGYKQFFESPRYATGYTALFGTVGYVVETHMLKPYKSRVAATYAFMLETISYTDTHHSKLKELRAANALACQPGQPYPVQWEIDSSKVDHISFLGYEGLRKKSEVSSGDRLYYDRNKPYKKNIPFLRKYKPRKSVVIPMAYIIPRGQWEVVEKLLANGVKMREFPADTTLSVESYRIQKYETVQAPYEGHYLHYNTDVSSQKIQLTVKKGDYIVDTRQRAVRYLLEALEPEAVDSFFNWNFFDSILQQKEWYSDYVFEDLAAEMLKKDAGLKRRLDEKRRNDAAFAADPAAQLAWVYLQSEYYESAHMRYPVYRLMP